jgi:hypothetical protein
MRSAGDSVSKQEQVRQLATAYFLPRAVYVAAELDLAQHLANGPKDAATLAGEVDADGPTLYRLLRALSGAGIFVEDEAGRFSNTESSELLRDDSAGSCRAFVRLLGDEVNWRSWEHLLYSVRTGRPAFDHVFGQRSFDYLSEHPAKAAVFDAAMVNSSDLLNAALIAQYDFAQYRMLVDVGGGVGATLCNVLHANPGMRGMVFELNHVVERAQRYIEAQRLSQRCSVVAGSFFDGVPTGGDAYFLKHVLHDWGDRHCLQILRACRSGMPAEAKLLICERVIPPGNGALDAKLMDLHMLVKTQGGRERTEAEYRDLLTMAGFEVLHIVKTQSAWSVLEASIRA